ncbi:MAG: HIT family protein [Anaerolineae bacterium]
MSQEPDACVFCKIVQGSATAYRIAEDEKSLALLDINPFAQGHVLVISKRHVPWWHELDDEETASLFKLANRVANKIMTAYSPDFVLLYARGRRIPHTHIFLVPSYGGDILDRFFNALEKVQETSQDLAQFKQAAALQEAAQRLREAGEDIP